MSSAVSPPRQATTPLTAYYTPSALEPRKRKQRSSYPQGSTSPSPGPDRKVSRIHSPPAKISPQSSRNSLYQALTTSPPSPSGPKEYLGTIHPSALPLYMERIANVALTQIDAKARKESEKVGAKNLAKLLKNRCNDASLQANRYIGGEYLHPTVRDILDTVLGGDVKTPSQIIDAWTPPQFADVRQYIRDSYNTENEGYYLGSFNGIRLRGFMTGGLECQGSACNNFSGPGAIVIKHTGVTEEIPAVVLGSIAGTGTALIIDCDRNIYLYSPPNALDRPLPGTGSKLFLISQRGAELQDGNTIDAKVVENGLFRMNETTEMFDPERDLFFGLDTEDESSSDTTEGESEVESEDEEEYEESDYKSDTEAE